MQGKLNLLKEQINKMSRKESKSKKKSSKYNQKSSYKTVTQINQEISRSKKSNNKSRKSSKSHLKSHSFAAPKRSHTRLSHAHNTNTTFESMMRKGPVNIFNIKNYNILNSDKAKKDYDRNRHSTSLPKKSSFDSSAMKSPLSKKNIKKGINLSKDETDIQKIHNFFVFINNKESEAGLKKDNKRRRGGKSPQNAPLNSSFSKSKKLEKRYIKLANLLKKYPTSGEKSRASSLSRQKINNYYSSMMPTDPSGYELNALSDKIQNFTSELTNMRSEILDGGGMAQDSQTRNDSDRTQNTVRMVQNTENETKARRQPLGLMAPTFKKTETLMRELKSTLDMVSNLKPPVINEDCQTKQEKHPKRISFSNLNIMNLMKEVAKEVLVKGDMTKPSIENLEAFCDKIGFKSDHQDPEKQVMIKYIMTSYQEQLIFEEALSILQEKNVDLENLFIYAYQRLKIKVSETERGSHSKDGDGLSEPSFTVVTDVSLPSTSELQTPASTFRGEREGSGSERGMATTFNLDIGQIKKDEEDEDEEDSQYGQHQEAGESAHERPVERDSSKKGIF